MEGKKAKSAIEEITVNEGTFSNEVFTPSYINFFYGKNGSGKTSIGRQIESGSGIKWAEGESASNYQIHVYNQDYIDLRFKTLDKVNGIFTLTEGDPEDDPIKKIEALEEERKTINKRQEEINKDGGEREKVSKMRQAAESTFQGACLRNTKVMRDKYKPAFNKASRNPQLSQKIESSIPKDCNEEELERLFSAAFAEGARPYPFFMMIDGEEHIAKVPTCDLLSEPITSSGNSIFAKFVKELQSLSWIEAGHKQFHDKADGMCPYCRQPLPADYETQLASCYDEQYQNALDTIKTFRQNYRAHMGVIFTILKNAVEQETPPSLAHSVKGLQPQIDNFTRAVQSNLELVDEKIANPSKVVQLEDLTPILLDLAFVLTKFNNEVQKNNDMFAKLGETQEQCIKDVWGLIAYQMQGEVETYHLALEEAVNTTKNLNDEEDKNKKRLEEIKEEIALLSKSSITIQNAIGSINTLLRDSGFEGFEIIPSDVAKDAYKVVRGDKKVAVRLSEGEKHFLSFLYFYYQVKGCDENGVMKEKIVVIDDPVSSLDGNALFITSSLVREMIEVCYNNAEYEGETEKGDYIRQLFILTHNAQFHRGITYKQVNRYRTVNFYKINKLNNHSFIKPCVRPDKSKAGEEEVNYNPVKNAYAALWAEYQELENPIPLMNVIHRIMDYYFLDICGEDGMDIRERVLRPGKNDFDGKTRLLADSMLQYMGAGINGDASYDNDEAEAKQIKETFEKIFESLGQSQHYNMMMERSRL